MVRVAVLHSQKFLVEMRNLLNRNHLLLDPRAVMTTKMIRRNHVDVLFHLRLLDLHPDLPVLHHQEVVDAVPHLDHVHHLVDAALNLDPVHQEDVDQRRRMH